MYQGHRFKVKVTGAKNCVCVSFSPFSGSKFLMDIIFDVQVHLRISRSSSYMKVIRSRSVSQEHKELMCISFAGDLTSEGNLVASVVGGLSNFTFSLSTAKHGE